jgi:hypothetical protein
MAKIKTLLTYLRRYYQFQDRIILVSRPDTKSVWSDRCFFLDNNYDPLKHYNHRSILHNEIVIEFDDDDYQRNLKNANEVFYRLKKDKHKPSKWKSGNKSVHVHCFVDIAGARNVSLLKKSFMRYYCKGIPLPDLQLASDNHLIRAEFGLHEKTGNHKEPLYVPYKFPEITEIPQPVWDEYVKQKSAVIKRTITTQLKDITQLEGFKYILSTHNFRQAEDGRERAMFLLIHTLKHNYTDKNEFIRFIQDWYKYSGGYKLTAVDIENKVKYHWNRDYTLGERYLNELLESIGKEELIKRE